MEALVETWWREHRCDPFRNRDEDWEFGDVYVVDLEPTDDDEIRQQITLKAPSGARDGEDDYEVRVEISWKSPETGGMRTWKGWGVRHAGDKDDEGAEWPDPGEDGFSTRQL